MIYKILEDGKILIQFVLADNNPNIKSNYSKVLNPYGNYKFIGDEIIEFVSFKPETKPNMKQAKVFVSSLNKKLEQASLVAP